MGGREELECYIEIRRLSQWVNKLVKLGGGVTLQGPSITVGNELGGKINLALFTWNTKYIEEKKSP